MPSCASLLLVVEAGPPAVEDIAGEVAGIGGAGGLGVVTLSSISVAVPSAGCPLDAVALGRATCSGVVGPVVADGSSGVIGVAAASDAAWLVASAVGALL